jgi:ligand-binding sensor domain-containing protein/signal transduction histidine kinase
MSIANLRLTRGFVVLPMLLLLAAGAGHAQRKSIKQYVHRIWTTSEGLPQNSASDIVQTRDGYLWFATQEGLARFDGMEFTVYDRTNTPELPASWFVRMREDSIGGIWLRPIGYAPGVVRFSGGRFSVYTTSNGLPSNRTLTWESSHDGKTWVGTNRGLAEWNAGKFKTYSVSDGLPADTVTGLRIDSKDRLWIITSRGLARLSNGTIERMTGQKQFPDTVYNNVNQLTACFEDRSGTIWLNTPTHLVAVRGEQTERFEKKTVLNSPAIRAMYQDTRGTIWITTAAGLNSFAGGQFTKYTASQDQDQNSLFGLREDKEGSLWIGTGKGFTRFADGKFESYTRADGLSDNGVQGMLIDREGSIWISTFGGGVDRFRDEKFITYSTRAGLSDDNTESVLQDHTGAIWVGTAFGALNRISNGVITHFEVQGGPGLVETRALSEDANGTLWIGSTRGAYTLENGKLVVRSKQVNGNPDITGDAYLLRKSGEFLVGSRNDLMKVVGGKFEKIASVPNRGTGQREFINSLFEDKTGRVWISTQGQLFYYTGDTLVPVGAERGFTAEWAMSFHEDEDGTLWIGTGSAGLFRFKEGKFVNISPQQGLFDYNVYNVLADQQGYFWMSSNRGVFRVSRQELNDVADGKASSLTYTSYGTADGMELKECNGGYASPGTVLKDGRICIVSARGLVIVNPADIRINQIPPPVVISHFVVEGEDQPTGGSVRIPAGKSRFEFHYAGMSFVGSEKVRYKYKLDGSDEGWIDAGSRREAYYTHLDPGEYTFHVIAANADGIWNQTGATTSFILQPYFYQTAWFIGIIGFLFLTAGPSFYLYRTRNLKKRKAELEALVQERTGELQTTVNNLKETQNQLILSEKMASLGQLTAGIAHEIKNPLNFITNFSVLSHDLTRDLRKELQAERDRVDPARAKEIESLLNDLEQNVTKINDHGKRADSIVRGMLLHSRGKAGERQDTDLNALLAEYTTLAYHGMRAQDQSFNVKIETDFDPSIGTVSVVPQDLSRAILNIVNNACYAANDKKKSSKNGFTPIVRVTAKSRPGAIEIRIRDNGNGIPQSIREKIFNPFFTTKPAGSGTGLGLSLSYDIITQEHHGEIHLDSKEGEYTEFLIVIPRNPESVKGNGA